MFGGIIEKPVPGTGATPVGTPPKTSRADLKNLDRMGIVYFDRDQSAIKGGESPKLDALASKMKSNNGLRVKLVGVADFYGPDDYNLALSHRRAVSAKNYLVSKGIAANRIDVDGQGEVASAPGETAQHRRVDIYELK